MISFSKIRLNTKKANFPKGEVCDGCRSKSKNLNFEVCFHGPFYDPISFADKEDTEPEKVGFCSPNENFCKRVCFVFNLIFCFFSRKYILVFNVVVVCVPFIV